MKFRLELIISILAMLSPVCVMVIMLFTEPELVEAIFGGLIIGSFFGSVLGIISLILNKGKSELVSIFSIIPMLPTAIYLMALLP
ncbi:MAG: hypothetical protein E7410_06410 [Ruminococcaceae bacterium]|nr:hypothetical protein [Oscillospiraceae bacterium]